VKRKPAVRNQRGVSIGEVLLIILLISILAIVMMPRFLNVSREAKWEACRTNVANINALVQLYYIKEGTWPVSALTDIGTNTNYFPEGALPDCPVTDSAPYAINPVSGHRVSGHLRGQSTHP
jgi:general secretion pathway protein G